MNNEFDYDLISKDYIPDDLQDDDRLFKAKTCIQSLNRMEKRILLTYVELQTYAAASKEFHVSPPTFKHYLQGILEKVRDCACGEEIITEENDRENVEYNN